MNRDILIDADVVSHFISAGREELLSKIFPGNQILLLDKVYDELARFRKRQPVIDRLVREGVLTLMAFPEDNMEIKKEYAYIKKSLFKGDGESACMAVARNNNNIIASSNLRDIRQYCQLHFIDFLATMDFLCAALRNNFLSVEECDEFIKKVIDCGSKLPVIKMSAHKCRDLSFIARK